ncbi:MAG: DUF1232 domain-containing protein [Sedimentisphaerales bacterium]|nr:DUF1232 domain-containing protein [Sedimentisphaerales bacterium]
MSNEKVNQTTEAENEKVPKITYVEVRRVLKENRKIAEEYASDKGRTKYLLDEAIRKAKRYKGLLKKCWDDLTVLIRLVREYINGEYKDVSWETIVLVTAAIIYFINPIDLIPDFIPGIGLIDDATVIAFTVTSIRKDLDKFREWERATRKKKQ